MELWEKIIVEWINCLKIVTEPVKSTRELQDGSFYNNFLKLIKWNKCKSDNDGNESIIRFLEDEYSSFKVNTDDSIEHVYIASLLLVHLCRTLSSMYHSLQFNMCDNLKHETQIKVKAFLESILPIGKDITKETMREVIMEVEDMSMTPQRRECPLSASPVTCSARSKRIMTERIRELRELRSSLAVEQFANADLRDDLARQQAKIQKLQSKLDEQSAQLKTLRQERMKPNTPKPAVKAANSQDGYYKKYIDDLESQLKKQEDEIDQLETEKEALSKELSSVQRTFAHYKENSVSRERSMESLSSKMESKDRELVELRIHNEELRGHLKELNKDSKMEQSFEVDDLMLFPAMKSLNTSEALSSVIEIQLQEAKEESAILHAQVDSLKEKLNMLTKDHKAAMEANRDLQVKAKTLDKVQVQLSDAREEIDALNKDLTDSQTEKLALVAQNQDLKSLLSTREEELHETRQSHSTLITKKAKLKLDLNYLNELFENERTNSSNLSSTVESIKAQLRDHVTRIHELTDERDAYRSSIENCSKDLKCILDCDNQFIKIETEEMDTLTLDDLPEYFGVMLRNCDTACASYKRDIVTLEMKGEETNGKLLQQQLIASTLEEENKQHLAKLANMEEDGERKNLLLNEQQGIVQKSLQQLEDIRNEKLTLERNLRELTNDATAQGLLLNSFAIQFQDLGNVKKDYKLMREELRRSIMEYRESIKATFEDVQHDYRTLCCNLQHAEEAKKDLEYNFNLSKKKFSDVQATNVALRQDLSESRKEKSALEEKERCLRDELDESKRYAEELREINHKQEQQYATTKTEAENNLEILRSANTKISLDLKSAVDKLNLLQEEVDDASIEIKLKEAQISELLSDVASLRAEKEHLVCSRDKALKMKDEELASKEETSLLLQTEMERLRKETSATEKKLREIILNLQEVRTSQDAVLATQEAALKEKCTHIDELQEQLDAAKQTLKTELERTQSSLRECQSKLFDLENQINKKNKTITDITEELKELKAEFEKNREYRKTMDENRTKIVELCRELEQSAKNFSSTVTEACSDSEFFDEESCDTTERDGIADDEVANILNIIRISRDELRKSQKLVLHLSCANVELDEALAEQRLLTENVVRDREEEACSLRNKIQELEIIAEKRNEYLKNLIKDKESLREHLEKVFASQRDLDAVLAPLRQKWGEILSRFEDIFHCFADGSVCDEFKQLRAKKANLENLLSKYQMDHSENMKFISNILWEKFLWTEQKLHDTHLCSVHEKECLEVLTSAEEDKFSNERRTLDAKLKECEALQTDIMKSEGEIDSLIPLLTSYKDTVKLEVKNQADVEKNLQNQIGQLTKEGKTMKSKMDMMRLRNVKLEKNIDDLRMEMKKLKSTETASTASTEVEELQSLRNEVRCLREANQTLREEKEESSRAARQELDSQLKEVHTTYERKLEDMKHKIKLAYNEQMTKLSHTQEKTMRERLQTQMEAMCQKQREELNRYKVHVAELSAQLWSVGEKLLNEEQQKQEALERLQELQVTLEGDEVDQPTAPVVSRKMCKTERQEILSENVQQANKVTTLIKEETFERRHSIRSIQVMGNAFKTEDEEEVFDNVYLADIKRGSCPSITNDNRLSVLQMRNSLCKPHLKSSYPAEMQFLPSTLTEEEIKSGSLTEENFNDSLSQSLLPEQKIRRKDRTQTSYKKPGPPTPSKNAGRLSLQGNEVKSPGSRILKERNVDRRTTTTPHSLKNIFSSKRHDENVSGTPKGRRLSSLFRKPRLQPDRSDR